MFCPHCGNDCPDNAAFCGKCGYEFGDRAAQAAPSAPSRPTAGTAGPGKGLPIVPIVAVGAILATGGIVFALTRGAPKPAASQPKQVEPTAAQSTSSAAQGTSSAAGDAATGEAAPNRISPKEHIQVSNLSLRVDDVQRYVLTGTVTNSSTDTYDVELQLFATRHSSDSYGEETTRRESIRFDTTTPFTTSSGNRLKISDLAPGETEFTVFPEWSSVEEFLSDPVCEIDKVTLPDANASSRYDHDGGIRLGERKLTQDGRLEVSFTNETGLYLSEAKIRVVCYKGTNLPAVKNSNGARPYGAVTKEGSFELLKPGDSGTFVIDVGEGYSEVGIMDIRVTADKDKNTFN